MRILVVDSLMHSIDFSHPFGGMIKGSIDECVGLSTKHDVTFAFCGKDNHNKKFKSLVIDEDGAYDKLKKSGTDSKNKLKYYKELYSKLTKIAGEYDVIFCYTYIGTGLDILLKRYIDTPKIIVLCDAPVDLFIGGGLMCKLEEFKEMNSLIVSISEFTRWLLNYSYNTRYKDYKKIPKISHLDPTKWDKFVDDYYRNFIFVEDEIKIGTNKGYSVNIGRFDKEKESQRLINLHKYNDQKLYFFGQVKPHSIESENYFNQLKKLEAQHENYKVHLNYNKEQMFDIVKNADNGVISWTKEGFGYTAYEWGIYGVPSIIVKKWEKHATEEYLERIGAAYKSVFIHEKEKLYDLMKNFKLTDEERLVNANKFREFFTMENFVKDRERLIEMMVNKMKLKTKKLF